MHFFAGNVYQKSRPEQTKLKKNKKKIEKNINGQNVVKNTNITKEIKLVRSKTVGKLINRKGMTIEQ